jgi:hypothetical protein
LKEDAELEPFVRLIEALEPWLEQVVFIGGWAHRLYRLDPRAQGPAAHNSRQRYRCSIEDRSQRDEYPGPPTGGRISRRVCRGNRNPREKDDTTRDERKKKALDSPAGRASF